MLEEGHGFLGSFSQHIYVNPIRSIGDTQLSYIIGNIKTNIFHNNSYEQYVFESQPSSFRSSPSESDRYARALTVVMEEALTSAHINSSSTKTGNLLMVTSNRNCDVVQKVIFSYYLRLDSLCFALCSSPSGMKRIIELYKVQVLKKTA